MYKNLVLCSGDLKGFIILGYLKTIENDIKNIKEYIGCSVGTIINFFLLINYSIDEIYKIFKDEFNEFLNLIQNEYNILNNIDEYLIKLYFNNGLLDMNILNKILTKHLKIKLNKNKLTFIECAKLYGKNFITTVSNITKHKLEYCDINNTPELNIIDAVCMSCAIPIIAKPIKYNDCLYVDGALYYEFPLNYFKNNYLDTIGVYIDYNIEKNKYDNIFEYIYYIICGLIKNNSKLFNNLENKEFNKFKIYKIDLNKIIKTENKILNEIIKNNYNNYILNDDIIEYYYNYAKNDNFIKNI